MLHFYTENIDVSSEKLIWGQRIFTNEEIAEVVLDKKNNQSVFGYQSVLVGNVGVKAKGVVIRQSKVYANSVNIGIWGASDYHDGTFAFHFSNPADVVLQQTGDSIIVLNAGEEEFGIIIREPFKKEVVIKPGEWIRISEKKEERAVRPLMFPLFNER